MPRKASEKSSSKDAIELLNEDHKKVLRLFSEFEKIKDEDDEEAKQILVEKACAELTMHTQVEEEFFYPAMRDVLDKQELIDEAEVEHGLAKQLVSELESMEPQDDLYNAKFTVLGEYIKHHIEEEQDKIFPKAKKAKVDLETLGEDILHRKEELRAEFGMQDEEEEDEQPGRAEHHKKTSRNIRPS